MLASILTVRQQGKNLEMFNVGDVLKVPLCVEKNGTAVVTTNSPKLAQSTNMKMRSFRSFGGANNSELMEEWGEMHSISNSTFREDGSFKSAVSEITEIITSSFRKED